jgi:hypothetical protein
MALPHVGNDFGGPKVLGLLWHDRMLKSEMRIGPGEAGDTMALHGTLTNGTIVLDQALPLPEGTRVEVVVTPIEDKKPTLSERLLKHAGTVPDLPSDMAEQHDHYIHGTARR